MRKTVFSLFLVCLFALKINLVGAQGTFRCAWVSGGVCAGASCCDVDTASSCNPGYQPNPYYCHNFSADKTTCDNAPAAFCVKKITGSCGAYSIETAIGCINVASPNLFAQSLLTFALGVGGGIACLLYTSPSPRDS